MKFSISFLCALFYSSNTKNVREEIDLSIIRDKAQFYIYVSLHNEIQEDAK